MNDNADYDFTSFIDYYDSSKYNISDYKLIILLGDNSINNENYDGKCLFVPVLESDKESKGEYTDGYIQHHLYLDYVLDKYFGISDYLDIEEQELKIVNNGCILLYNMVIKSSNELLDDEKYSVIDIPDKLSDNQLDALDSLEEGLAKENFILGFNYLDNNELQCYFNSLLSDDDLSENEFYGDRFLECISSISIKNNMFK